MNEITAVFTSCGRPDLLSRTIESFKKFNSYPIKKSVIVEDSGSLEMLNFIKSNFTDFEIIFNEKNLGQIKSIDKCYNTIDTEYIFHCEDDWEFYNTNFIEDSLNVLLLDPKILQMHLRHFFDLNGHPVEPSPFQNLFILKKNHNKVWNGFSFNPGLKRLKDYKLLGSYEATGHESDISLTYANLGYYAVVKNNSGYVRHIGWGRHTEDLRSKDLIKNYPQN